MNSNPIHSGLTRRHFLRSSGIALALPYLDSLLPRKERRTQPPVRLVFVYAPNGLCMERFLPKGHGSDWQLSPLLEELRPHKRSLLVLSGLAHSKARANGDGPGDHARAAATFLTGTQALKRDGAVRAGLSADQAAAQAIGSKTRLRSLEISLEAGRLQGQCDSGYSCAYSNTISYAGPSVPCPRETDPGRIFDLLFGDPDAALSEHERARRARTRRSVLDFVRDDATALAGRLGHADRHKLDQYLSGLRELERRLAARSTQRDELESSRPDPTPDDFVEAADLQAQLLAAALRSDTTRVASWMLANEGSGRSYPSYGVPEGHHELSHHGGDPQKLAKLERINRLHLGALRSLLDQLAEPIEDEPPLLEQCAVAFGSGIADGDRHDHHDLPILVAGQAGNRWRTDRHLELPEQTPCCNLWLRLLHAASVPLDRLGDSTEPLEL